MKSPIQHSDEKRVDAVNKSVAVRSLDVNVSVKAIMKVESDIPKSNGITPLKNLKRNRPSTSLQHAYEAVVDGDAIVGAARN